MIYRTGEMRNAIKGYSIKFDLLYFQSAEEQMSPLTNRKVDESKTFLVNFMLRNYSKSRVGL